MVVVSCVGGPGALDFDEEDDSKPNPYLEEAEAEPDDDDGEDEEDDDDDDGGDEFGWVGGWVVREGTPWV